MILDLGYRKKKIIFTPQVPVLTKQLCLIWLNKPTELRNRTKKLKIINLLISTTPFLERENSNGIAELTISRIVVL